MTTTVRLVLPDGDEVEVGTLRFAAARGRESTVFTYTAGYIEDPRAYPVDPLLPLRSGPFVTGEHGLYGAMSDSAPDRWGENLLRRAERGAAREQGRTSRTLLPSHFLLGVHDELRQGALRYTDESGAYLSGSERGVPRAVELPALLDLTDRALHDPSLDSDLRDLVDAGGSLGGARPKAAVRDHTGTLMIAKFPRTGSDEWEVMAWEKLTLDLASRAHVDVPPNELITVLGRRVLLLERFDREGTRRRGYMSAMTLLGVGERTNGLSFAELAEELETVSADPVADLHQLYRRALLGSLVSNSDNHARNHGFLRTGTGWALSPAFDMNPDPERTTPVMPIVPGGGDLVDAIEVADAFRLTRADSLSVLASVLDAVDGWERRAGELGIEAREVALMRSAFETELTEQARRLLGR